MSKLCDGGKDYRVWDPEHSENWLGDSGGERPVGVPRKRVRCPKCGRKLLTSVEFVHDGDVLHTIPKHKPKGWWKKNKNKHPHKERGRQV